MGTATLPTLPAAPAMSGYDPTADPSVKPPPPVTVAPVLSGYDPTSDPTVKPPPAPTSVPTMSGYDPTADPTVKAPPIPPVLNANGGSKPKPLNALPPVAQAMYNRVGMNCTGTECGQFISDQIAAHGGGGTVTSLESDILNRVKPGPDGTVPDGTGVFFPSANGDPNGQHFVLAYKDAGGNMRALEDTQTGAGGNGQRVVRADRLISQVQRAHGTQPVYFHVPGGSAPSQAPDASSWMGPQAMAEIKAMPGSPYGASTTPMESEAHPDVYDKKSGLQYWDDNAKAYLPARQFPQVSKVPILPRNDYADTLSGHQGLASYADMLNLIPDTLTTDISGNGSLARAEKYAAVPAQGVAKFLLSGGQLVAQIADAFGPQNSANPYTPPNTSDTAGRLAQIPVDMAQSLINTAKGVVKGDPDALSDAVAIGLFPELPKELHVGSLADLPRAINALPTAAKAEYRPIIGDAIAKIQALAESLPSQAGIHATAAWKPIGNDTYTAPSGMVISPQDGGGYEVSGPNGKISSNHPTPQVAMLNAPAELPSAELPNGFRPTGQPNLYTNDTHHVTGPDSIGNYTLYGPGGKVVSEGHPTPEAAMNAAPTPETSLTPTETSTPATAPAASVSLPAESTPEVTARTPPVEPARPVTQTPPGQSVKLSTTQDIADAFMAAHTYTPEEAAGIKAILDAHADDWAKSTGHPASEYAPSVWSDVIKGEPPVERTKSVVGGPNVPPSETAKSIATAERPTVQAAPTMAQSEPLEQRGGRVKGQVSFDPEDGRAVVKLFKAADVSTAVHEIAHVWRKTLAPDALSTFEDAYGVENGKWTVPHEERFARDFEKYLADGKAPKPTLQQHFDNFKAWLGRIYKSAKNSPLAGELHPNVKAAFDKMVGGDRAEAVPEAATTTEMPTEPKVKPPSREMVRSINLGHINADERGLQAIRDADKELTENLNYPEKIDVDKVREGADRLGLTPDSIDKWFKANPDAHVPSGVHPALFTKAVADQLGQTADRISAASQQVELDPTMENKSALKSAQSDLEKVQPALQALRRLPAQTLWSFNLDTDRMTDALQKAQERAQRIKELPNTSNMQFNAPSVKRVFTAGKRAAALARLDQAKPLEQREESQTLYQLGDNPDRVNDLTDVGGFHYEEGAKTFDDWSAKMKADQPSLDAEDLTRIYSNVKNEIAKGRRPRLQERAELSFGDELATRIGRAKATDLINTLTIDHPGALQKILDGRPQNMTAEERQSAADLYQAASRKSGAKAPTNAAVQSLADITKQIHPPVRGKPRPMANTLEAAVKQRIGTKGWASMKMRAEIDSELSTAMGKLDRGESLTDAQKRAVQQTIDDLRTKPKKGTGTPISQQLTEIGRAAKAGEIGFSDQEAIVRHILTQELLQSDPERLTKALTDVGTVKPGDTHDLANKFNRWVTPDIWTKQGALDKLKYYIRSALLSGPRTIARVGIGHIIGNAAEEGVNAALAGVSRGKLATSHPMDLWSGWRSAFKALPEAGRILKEGTTAHELRGIAPYYRQSDLPGKELSREAVMNPAVRQPLRWHSALFTVLGRAAEETALVRTARIWARNFGGNPEDYLTNPDVKIAAADYASEMIYSNPNKLDTMIKTAIDPNSAPTTRGAHKLSAAEVEENKQARRIASGIVTVEAPFRRTPLNILGRGLEYSGAGVPVAGVRLIGAKLSGALEKMTPTERLQYKQTIGRQAVRGVLGPATLAGVGAYLTAKGILNPPNQKTHEYGSINYKGNKYDINQLAPVATPVELGGEIYLAIRGKSHDFLAPYTDSPFSNAQEQITQAEEGLKSGKAGMTLAKLAGATIAEFVPTIFSQIASSFDPKGVIRVKKGIIDASMNRVPFLREKLKAYKFPQPSNYKSTGWQSVLSPIDVEKREKTR